MIDVELPPKDVGVEEEEAMVGMVNARPCVASGDRSVKSDGEGVDLMERDALDLDATAKI